MIAKLGLKISELFRRTAPDPFVLAVLLTLITIVLAAASLPAGSGSAIERLGMCVDFWSGTEGGAGLWSLLAFGMQMCLILVTGHALASSPPVAALLSRLSEMPRNGWQAAALVAFIAVVLGVLNWGLALIAGALVARRVGVVMHERGTPVHYPLIAASGYVGLLVWHGGFSGSAPLKVTKNAEIVDVFGENPPFEAIALSETILSPMNLFVTGGLLLIVPLVMAMLSPRPDDMHPVDRFVAEQEAPVPTPQDKAFVPRLLEDTPLINAVLVALIMWWAWGYYGGGGLLRLTPNTVNLTMLALGLILHATPSSYLRAVDEAVRGCSGIILQFPLYAGIMGVMHASGLTEQLATALGANAGETGMPLITFCLAAVVNLFVPSGGGQWAVQGPIAMNAAVDLGIDPGKAVMAVAYGDQLTNMLQPFWALPLLAITGVKARDIVGYTAVLMVIAGLWMLLGLMIF